MSFEPIPIKEDSIKKLVEQGWILFTCQGCQGQFIVKPEGEIGIYLDKFGNKICDECHEEQEA